VVAPVALHAVREALIKLDGVPAATRKMPATIFNALILDLRAFLSVTLHKIIFLCLRLKGDEGWVESWSRFLRERTAGLLRVGMKY